MTPGRGILLVLLLAAAAYANSLGNGFAYDDEGIILQNPVVLGGDWAGAMRGSWWPMAREGAGLHRPLTTLSFVGEWRLFGGDPLGYHALNLFFHAMVSLVVFLLLLSLGSLPGALAGGAVFAVHPVHTEAVANVVGRAEIYAALFCLAACLLYWRGREWRGARRALRLLGLGALFFLSLSSKEIGVTLPGVLLLLELFRPRLAGKGSLPFPRRVLEEGATFMVLGLVLAAWLGIRFLVLGTVAGERAAPVLELVGPGARVLSAVAIWAQYLRLHLFPLDLAVDYDPGVLFPSVTFDLPVALGATVLLGLGLLSWKTRRVLPLVSLGTLWFGVTILPVSNLFFSTGVLLAERTLYLPSVGLSLVVSGMAAGARSLPPLSRRLALAAAVAVVLAFLVRTVVRNPSWMSTFVVQQTLNQDHPESWRAFRARAQGLERVGETGSAAEAWDMAAALAPLDYTLLVQAGDFHGRLGDWERGEAYLRQAVAVGPELANAYQVLAGHLLRRGEGRAGHGVALEGLARAGPDGRLWALVSESYLLKGDLPAALRARDAAIGAEPRDPDQWRRLAQIREAAGDSLGAVLARERARELETDPTRSPEGTGS